MKFKFEKPYKILGKDREIISGYYNKYRITEKYLKLKLDV